MSKALVRLTAEGQIPKDAVEAAEEIYYDNIGAENLTREQIRDVIHDIILVAIMHMDIGVEKETGQ